MTPQAQWLPHKCFNQWLKHALHDKLVRAAETLNYLDCSRNYPTLLLREREIKPRLWRNEIKVSCLSEVCLLFSVYFFWIPWPKIRLFSFGSKQLLQCLYQHSESALIKSELLRVWRLKNARKVLKNRKHKTCTLCNILNPSTKSRTPFGITQLEFLFVFKLSWVTTNSLIHISQHLNETAHCANGSLIKILYSAVLYAGYFYSDHLACVATITHRP